jgi:hypothetical protein
MTTTAQLTAPPPSTAGRRRDARALPPRHLASGGMLDEVLPLIGVVAVAGPPVVLLAGPLSIFVLALIAPFALLLTFAALFVVAVAFVAFAGAVLAAPFLLVDRLRAHRARRASVTAHVMLVAARSPRATA